jgi:hypothetical protein
MPLKTAQTINRFIGILTVTDCIQVVERVTDLFQMTFTFALRSEGRSVDAIGPWLSTRPRRDRYRRGLTSSHEENAGYQTSDSADPDPDGLRPQQFSGGIPDHFGNLHEGLNLRAFRQASGRDVPGQRRRHD